MAEQTGITLFSALQTATIGTQSSELSDEIVSEEQSQDGEEVSEIQLNSKADNYSNSPINNEDESTERTRIQRVRMESFIKVMGNRKVTTEILSADGEVISTDVQEVDDEPECFKISSQEKFSYGEPSSFEIQKPDNFVLPYQFLKQTNFCTSISLRCPKFVNNNSGDKSDPVFTSLNLSKQHNSHFPDIQAIKSNVHIQMKQWKTVAEPKPVPLKKPKLMKKVVPKALVSNEVAGESVESHDDVIIIGSREGKRVRKPTKKMLEYQEREKAETAENFKKVHKSMTIKTEPGLLDTSSKNSNSNNNNTPIKSLSGLSKTTKHPIPNLQVIKDELEAHESKLNPFSGDVIECTEPNGSQAEQVEGNTLTREEIVELLNIPPLELNPVEKKEAEIHDDGSSTIKPLMAGDKKEEDFSVFDDDEEKVDRYSKRFSCCHCPSSFNNRLSLNKHMYQHRKAKDIIKDECKLCNKTFYSRYVYECHMLKHIHQTPEGKFRCLVCEKEFISRGGLLKHQRSGKGCKGTQFRCEFCGIMYNSLHTLDIHKRKCHILSEDCNETCDHCGKQFETKGGLSKHKRNKACETHFACEICGKTFNNATRFEKHKLTHKDNKPSTVCDVCGKSLSTPASLAVHKNSHANIRKFECNVCHKSFLQKGTLVAHQRIHTGERPYLCNTCGASFRYNSHLTQHENLHTGKIKYPCTKCERSFYTRHSLKKHLISHERKARLDELKKNSEPDAVVLLKPEVQLKPEIQLKPEELNIADVVVGENEIVFLNEVVGEEDGETQFIYTTEDGQQCFLTNSAEAIVTSDQQIEYQDGQNIIYQTVEGDNVTFVDEMQTSDLSILAETAQNYENSGVTYVIVKK